MSLQKIGGGYYYVEGRNGLPGRSFPKLREAQRYDQELERAACAVPKTTTPPPPRAAALCRERTRE